MDDHVKVSCFLIQTVMCIEGIEAMLQEKDSPRDVPAFETGQADPDVPPP